MNKFGRRLALVISLVAALVLVAGCSSRFVPQREEGVNPPSSVSISRPSDGLVKTHDGGSVTIEVEWGREEAGSLSFNVVMNTHSVDLDQYDLVELAMLRDDTGNEYRPASWDSAPGGHHRQGVLTFPLPESLEEGKAKYLELVIRDIAGIPERVMKWAL